MPRRWDHEKEKELIRLVSLNRYTYPEISKMLKLSIESIRNKGQHLGLKNTVYSKNKTVTKHLRKPVMKYFLNHTWDQTKNHFNLRDSQLKTIFTIGYRDPKLKHLRKDKRRKDPWSKEELLLFLKYSGLLPRTEIAKKLNRGTKESIKEMLAKNRLHSKNINGLPERLANVIMPIGGIKTFAGAQGKSGKCCIRLVLWTVLYDAIKYITNIDITLKYAIRAMARFQKWVYNTNNVSKAVNNILKEKINERNTKKRERSSF